MKVYKIFDPKQGRYRKRGYGWSKIGAVWTRKSDVAQVMKGLKHISHLVVLEYFLTPVIEDPFGEEDW